MKKYITLAALLVAGAAFANADTITVANLNKNLNYWLDECEYEVGDAYTLTFTIGQTVTGYTSANVLDLGSGWMLRTQALQYMGVTSDGDPTGWLGTQDQAAYSGNLAVGTDKWLFKGANVNTLSGVTIVIDSDGTSASIGISKGNDSYLDAMFTGESDAPVDLNLNNVKFVELVASSATIELGDKEYSLAIPEPSAFGLLAGLGALALVGARRRRR